MESMGTPKVRSMQALKVTALGVFRTMLPTRNSIGKGETDHHWHVQEVSRDQGCFLGAETRYRGLS